jgi:hypothetical protein
VVGDQDDALWKVELDFTVLALCDLAFYTLIGSNANLCWIPPLGQSDKNSSKVLLGKSLPTIVPILIVEI